MTKLILTLETGNYSNLQQTVDNNVKPKLWIFQNKQSAPAPWYRARHSIERRIFLAVCVCCGQLFWSVIGVYLPVPHCPGWGYYQDYITGPCWVLAGWPRTIFNSSCSSERCHECFDWRLVLSEFVRAEQCGNISRVIPHNMMFLGGETGPTSSWSAFSVNRSK